MIMGHVLTTAHDLFTFLLLPPCMFIQPVLQSFLNLIFGPRKKSSSSLVQTYQVLVNLKMHFAWPNDTSKYLLRFKGEDDISCLEDEDVYLSGVTDTEFHFIRPTRGVRITEIEKFPLQNFSLYDNARELIKVPHETIFGYLKGRKDTDGSNITILHNIGRCGSTLLGHMIYQTGECEVLSEPGALLQSLVMNNQATTPEKHQASLDIIKTTILLLCKNPTSKYFIKVTGMFSGRAVHLIHQILPGSRDIFLHRALIPTMISFNKVLGTIYFPSLGWDQTFHLALPARYQRIWQKIQAEGIHKRFLFFLLCQLHPFFLESQVREDLVSFSYESLMKDKEGFARSLLRASGLSEVHVQRALTALEHDSQRNTPLSRKRTAGVKTRHVTTEEREWARKVAREEFGIELTGEELTVANIPHSWEGKD